MTVAYASLADVRDALRVKEPAAWVAKMLHPVPELPVVPDRAKYLAQRAVGEVVLDLGCTGQVSEGIRAVAKGYWGVDCEPGDWAQVDFDVAPERIPVHPEVTLVLAAEILEHLANPGWFLAAIRSKYPTVPLLLTAPHAGAYRVRNGTHEEVNGDHVAWYSYTTLTTLLRRCGYCVEKARWYNGRPHKAEGLIVQARAIEA